MKVVELKSGKLAIPMNIKVYMTEEKMVKIITDIVHRGELDLSEKKNEVLKSVRRHLWYQGQTVYNDWYEDTVETKPINDIYKKVIPFVKGMFPEYCS